jgi:hypothetical protein
LEALVADLAKEIEVREKEVEKLRGAFVSIVGTFCGNNVI